MAVPSIVPVEQQNKIRLQRAKRLIHRRKYADARLLLATVTHPIARQWLHLLDEKELGNPFDTRPGFFRRVIVPTLLVVLLLFLLAVLKQQYDQAERIRQNISGYYNAVPASYHEVEFS